MSWVDTITMLPQIDELHEWEYLNELDDFDNGDSSLPPPLPITSSEVFGKVILAFGAIVFVGLVLGNGKPRQQLDITQFECLREVSENGNH